MANIKLSELNGAELFQDSESFLNELNDTVSLSVHGGDDSNSDFYSYTDYAVKYLEFLVSGYGISTIKEIVKSFSNYHY
ncbi:MAG TPA: hypothetical protein VK203_07580 [Nostocaceae cyanobacterium]|nr:hypothetical protein [Nostocaceae cyanobacterium]